MYNLILTKKELDILYKACSLTSHYMQGEDGTIRTEKSKQLREEIKKQAEEMMARLAAL